MQQLTQSNRLADTVPEYQIDPQTGLGLFHSGRLVTIDDVKALEDEDSPAHEAS
jgi:hypothetical protein